jgi:hypothetical protein
MARTSAIDMTGVEVTAELRKWGDNKGHLLVFISAPHFHDIAEVGEGRANILAAKRGFKMLEGVTQTEIERSAWDNQYKCTRIYTLRKAR